MAVTEGCYTKHDSRSSHRVFNATSGSKKNVDAPQGGGSQVVKVFPWPIPKVRSDEMQEAWKRIAYNPNASNRNIVADALGFLENMPADLPVPFAAVGEDGGASLEWFMGKKDAAVIFDGDGLFNFIVRVGDDYEGGVAPIPRTADSFPAKLLDYIRLHKQ